MFKKYFFPVACFLFSFSALAQSSYDEQVAAYIKRFKDMAIAEQKRTGIPASVKLAQGIFETGAGSSELSRNANNHFGIKCKSTWTGSTYTYTDDARDECFRKYGDAQQSYKDHSDFLKSNKRYSSLFDLSLTDYAAWAHGLKRCGYATNPQYARKLIKTIEDYRLQEYTYAAMEIDTDEPVLAASQAERVQSASVALPGEYIPQEEEEIAEVEIERVPAVAPQEKSNDSGVTDFYRPASRNGKKGFYARKGDILLEYAIKNKIRYAKLLELNDLPDAPLEADMFVYLERKGKTAKKNTHVVKDGETLLQISQHEGIQLAHLRALNHLEKDEEPQTGSVLQLQLQSEGKPGTYASAQAPRATPAVPPAIRKANNEGDFVATTQQKGRDIPEPPAVSAKTAAAPARDQQPARPRESVNIADEPAIEEVLARERSNSAPKAGTSAPEPEQYSSPLDKLKAHMDKTVYGRTAGQVTHTSEDVPEEEDLGTTLPVARQAAPRPQPSPAPAPRKTAAPAAAKAKARVHTVKRGDTAFGIAQKYGITVTQLKKWNKLSSTTVQIGTKLKVAP